LLEKPQRRFVEFIRRFPDDQVGGFDDKLDAQARLLFLEEGAVLRGGTAVIVFHHKSAGFAESGNNGKKNRKSHRASTRR